MLDKIFLQIVKTDPILKNIDLSITDNINHHFKKQNTTLFIFYILLNYKNANK